MQLNEKVPYSNPIPAKKFFSKFYNILGPENVGIGNKPKMNVIYAVLANNGIKPVGKNKYGVPVFLYKDLDGLTDRGISDGFKRWKAYLLGKDIDMSMRNSGKQQVTRMKKQPDTQTQISFVDENDDKLYESLFGRKVYFTESQIKYIKESLNKVSREEYIENDFNEKWKRLPEDSEIFQLVKQKTEFENKSNLQLTDVAIVEEKGHYIAVIYGGLNGRGTWNNYLKDIYHLVKQINNCTVVSLDCDVPDDTWKLTLSFEKEDLMLNEGWWGYEPDDSDTYWDLANELGKIVFEKILKDIDKNMKQKKESNVYALLGIITDLITVHSWTDEILLYSNRDIVEKDEKNLPIRIILTCTKAFKFLESDTENTSGWQDFEEYKKELSNLHNEFVIRMKKLNMKSEEKNGEINESINFVEPQKVLIVKQYLDDNFVRGNIPYIGDDGYPKTKLIVGLKGTDGKVAKNMDAQHLFYLLQDKFKGIYGDKEKRDKFLKQVMKDWYHEKITREGLLSVNNY